MNFRQLLPRTHANQFTQYDGDFSDYIEKMKKVVSQGRIDLTGDDAAKIVDSNAPFEWRPKTPNNKGVLLIHGLSDSPFMMRDLAKHFLEQGYLVRSVLLPGHGTVPGDMLNISHNDWLACVKYGIEQTSPLVEKLYLCGFSLGAGLSILNQDAAENIAGIIAIAPGLKVTHRFSFIPKIHKLFSWISNRAQWYSVRQQISHVKYFSHPFHSASLAMKIMNKVRKTKINIPWFCTISSDDETVKTDILIDYFKQQKNPKNRFILYTNDDYTFNDDRMTSRPSAYPEENIIDFSHMCIPISPDNHYLGRHGTFTDFSHYKNGEDEKAADIKLGAISAHNITHYTMQRLSYNPDFKYLMDAIDSFIQSL